MAVRVPLCIVVALQISLVFCKSDFYHQYFSRHHRGSTTTSVATPILSSADSSGTTRIFDEGLMPQRSDYWDRDVEIARQRMVVIGTIAGVVMGIFILITVVACCALLFCPCCKRGQQRTGYIINNNPQQQVVQVQQQQQQARQQSTLQQLPTEQQLPDLPPPYPTQQQQWMQNQWVQQHPSSQQQNSNVQEQEFDLPEKNPQIEQPLVDIENYPQSSAPPPYKQY